MGGVDIMESTVYVVFGPETVDDKGVADKNLRISNIAKIVRFRP